MVNWKEVIQIAKEEASNYYYKHQIPLTLRGLFYILVSKNIIPNTKNYYISLSRNLAYARYIGEFPYYLIHDKVREVSWGDIGYSISDANKVLEELNNLTPQKKEEIIKNYLKSRYSIKLSQWENQKHRVILFIEKDALYDIIYDIVRHKLGWDVTIACSRGFESASEVFKIAKHINKLRKDGIKPVLLLIYDFDPSGEYASIRDLVFRVLAIAKNNDISKLLDKWENASEEKKSQLVESLANELNVTYKKIMLTYEQVLKYNIPPTPESQEAIEKLKRDPRKNWFVEKYGNLYQAEVDALISLNINEAIKIIDNEIKQFFDFKIYEEVKKKEEELKKQVEEKLK
jgi:hypothetical protein